jgi:Arc/MetJ-type ribon-helix-helix transcriptional regulator
VNITLSPRWEEYVRRKLDAGEFACVEDVVSAGLHLLLEKDGDWASDARRKIDAAWEQAASGDWVSQNEARANLAERKRKWRNDRNLA